MDEKYKDKIRKRYKLASKFYFLADFILSGARRKIAELIELRTGAKVLDIAAGTGKQASAFAELGLNIIGIDISEHMLRLATQHAKHRNIYFCVSDAARLPIKDESVDGCCISFALHEIPQKETIKILSEMVRVTKSGGKIIVADYSLPKNPIAKFLAYNIIKLVEGKSYAQFIKLNMGGILSQLSIKVKREHSLFFGIGKITVGINLKE